MSTWSGRMTWCTHSCLCHWPSLAYYYCFSTHCLLCFDGAPGNWSKLNLWCVVRPLWLDSSLSLSHLSAAIKCLQRIHTQKHTPCSVCLCGQEQWAPSLTFTQKPGELAVEMMMKWCKELKPRQEGTWSQRTLSRKKQHGITIALIFTVSWLSITLSIFTI